MTESPLAFEPRPDGRTAAMLGAIPIGFLYQSADPHFPVEFYCDLPPRTGPVLVKSARAAKIRMHRHVRLWLKIAKLKDATE